MNAPDPTLTAVVRRRIAADGDRPFLRRDGAAPLTYHEFGLRAAAWGRLLASYRPLGAGEPFHVGVLAENAPVWIEVLGGCLLAGATLVALNTTRGAAELARDAAHTRCCVVVGDGTHLERFTGAAPGTDTLAFGPEADVGLARYPFEDPGAEPAPEDLAFLLFTSGTTSAPKAVRRTHGRAVLSAAKLAARAEVDPDGTGYANMPLFHAAALMMVVLPALTRGAAIYVAPRFSVSGFLDDVRRHGVTWWGYTGKPLTYLMASPARPGDADNPLRVAVGNEGNSAVCDAFADRFGCTVVDTYGATEGGIGIVRRSGDPPGSLGLAPPGVRILAADGSACPPAIVGADGTVLNAHEAVGEIVNTAGANAFEGYWDNPEATEARGGGGVYRSGDLGYADAGGYVYFAGRTDDWLRVDGENLAAGAIERLLERHPEVIVAAVVGVPDPGAGDQILAVLQRLPGSACDPAEVLAAMAADPDCGAKWLPRYVRVVDELPMTASYKVARRDLRRSWYSTPGTLERTASGLVPVDPVELRERYARPGRAHLLDLWT